MNSWINDHNYLALILGVPVIFLSTLFKRLEPILYKTMTCKEPEAYSVAQT